MDGRDEAMESSSFYLPMFFTYSNPLTVSTNPKRFSLPQVITSLLLPTSLWTEWL